MTDDDLRKMNPRRDPQVLREDFKTLIKIATDFLQGRRGLLGTSRALVSFSYFIDSREEPEFLIFAGIADAARGLPIGSDKEILVFMPTDKGFVEVLDTRTDEEIRAAIQAHERKYIDTARKTATSLVAKYTAFI